MKDEFQPHRLIKIINALKYTVLITWYVVGIFNMLYLWFFPLPQGRIQALLFVVVFWIYTSLHMTLVKIYEVKNGLE
jgi:hypothetical protein